MFIVEQCQVLFRDRRNADGAFCTDNFGLDMITVSRGTSGVHNTHAALFKVEQGTAGFRVTQFCKLREAVRRTDGVNRLRFVIQEPAHQINIMDRHVNKQPAGGSSKTQRTFNRFHRVDTDSLHKIRFTDFTGLDFFHSIDIGGVKAPHETEHKNLVRMRGNCFFRFQTFLNVHPQRFFAKDMFPGSQCFGKLFTVHAGGGHNRNRINVSFCKHFIEIRIKIRNTQFILCILQFRGNDRTGSRQAGARNTESDIFCVDLTKSAKSGDTDF